MIARGSMVAIKSFFVSWGNIHPEKSDQSNSTEMRETSALNEMAFLPLIHTVQEVLPHLKNSMSYQNNRGSLIAMYQSKYLHRLYIKFGTSNN